MPNDGGGKIVLLDSQCNIKDTWTAYTYLPSGHSLVGCWTAGGDRVFIDWGKNDIRSYPAGNFSLNKNKQPKSYM